MDNAAIKLSGWRKLKSLNVRRASHFNTVVFPALHSPVASDHLMSFSSEINDPNAYRWRLLDSPPPPPCPACLNVDQQDAIVVETMTAHNTKKPSLKDYNS